MAVRAADGGEARPAGDEARRVRTVGERDVLERNVGQNGRAAVDPHDRGVHMAAVERDESAAVDHGRRVR